jgi:hypothetical protein
MLLVRIGLMLAIVSAASLAGCGRSRGVQGGTPGVLRSAQGGLSEVQIQVHRADDLQVIGLAVTSAGGAFELVQPQAAGPLQLPPGEYVFTLESMSAVPLRLPPKTMNAKQSPLRKSWTASDTQLELVVP